MSRLTLSLLGWRPHAVVTSTLPCLLKVELHAAAVLR